MNLCRLWNWLGNIGFKRRYPPMTEWQIMLTVRGRQAFHQYHVPRNDIRRGIHASYHQKAW